MIEWTRVDQLRDEIGADDFQEVVVLFLEEVDEVIARLKSLTAFDSLADDLHFLKGSALNLGFRSFATVCQEGEGLAKSGQADQALVQRVIDSYAASRIEFLDGLTQSDRRTG